MANPSAALAAAKAEVDKGIVDYGKLLASYRKAFAALTPTTLPSAIDKLAMAAEKTRVEIGTARQAIAGCTSLAKLVGSVQSKLGATGRSIQEFR